MSKQATIWIKDEVNCTIMGLDERSIQNLWKTFGFYVHGYMHRPMYKLGTWDGKKRFFSKLGNTYVYLIPQIVKILRAEGYALKLKDDRNVFEFPSLSTTANPFPDFKDFDGSSFELRPYQIEAVNAVLKHNGGIMLAGTGSGKAQTLDSKILTTVGWVNMGDITTSHCVITPDNSIAKIVGIHPQPLKDVYRVIFHDGSSVKCCGEHLWKVKRPEKMWHANTVWDVVDTNYINSFIVSKNEGSKHIPGNISIPMISPIEYRHTEPVLPVDPYLLGALIGDGCLRRSAIMISTKDIELLKNIQSIIEPMGLVTKQCGIVDYRLAKPTRGHSYNSLVSIVRELGLEGCRSWEKFIPDQYKYSSVSDRWNLVQGLMDTDGTVGANGTTPSFSTTSRQLAKDLQQILWSLGCTCSLTERVGNYFMYNGIKSQGRPHFTLHIGCATPKMLFNLSRKKDKCNDTHGCGRIELTRRVIRIEHITAEPTQCISIDHPDHLYITDDFIVTHNTSMSATIAKTYEQVNFRTIIIVPTTSLVKQSADDLKKWGLDCGQYDGTTKELHTKHLVSTWQSLQNVPTLLAAYQVVVVDECQAAQASILAGLLEKNGRHIACRFGLTGTMPNDVVDNLQVKLMLGDVKYEIPAWLLIEQGYLSTLNIEMVELDEQIPINQFPDYASESAYLRTSKERTSWIIEFAKKLAAQPNGNTMVLVSSKTHGRKLASQIPGSYFVSGDDAVDNRALIYKLFAENDNLIVFITVQVGGTGLSIDRVFNLIVLDIGKSFIRTIQAIGRGLRKNVKLGKNHVNVYDIFSALTYSRKHSKDRLKFYHDAKYPVTKTQIKYKSDVDSLT